MFMGDYHDEIVEFEDKFEEFEVYLENFEELLNEVDGKMKKHWLDFFIGGLKEEIKLAQQTILWQTYLSAKIYEAHHGT